MDESTLNQFFDESEYTNYIVIGVREDDGSVEIQTDFTNSISQLGTLELASNVVSEEMIGDDIK